MTAKKIVMKLEDIQDFAAKEAFEEWKKLGTNKQS